MKAVLISLWPEWCELIVTGNKTVEVRKTKPKLETPFKVYIYCTVGVGKNTFCLPVSHKRIMEHYAETGSMDSLNAPIGNGKVIGQFICDEIKDMRDIEQAPTCLSIEEWLKYTDGHKGPVYGWHISDLKIYDKPKPLSKFMKPYGTIVKAFDSPYIQRPPQSWCYVEELRYE